MCVAILRNRVERLSREHGRGLRCASKNYASRFDTVAGDMQESFNNFDRTNVHKQVIFERLRTIDGKHNSMRRHNEVIEEVIEEHEQERISSTDSAVKRTEH